MILVIDRIQTVKKKAFFFGYVSELAFKETKETRTIIHIRFKKEEYDKYDR